MHATHFVLISRFRLHTDADAVWRVLTDVERWPQWWHYARRVQRVPIGRAIAETAPAATAVQGADIDWRSALAFGFRVRVTITRTQAPHLLESHVTGDLQGSALWLIEPATDGDAVDVSYRWEFDLRRPWMRRLVWLFRPAFAWSHFKVMHAGAQGMARQLGCGLSDLRDWSGGPH